MWNDCVLVWDGIKHTDDFADLMKSAFDVFASKYGLKERIWYDAKCDLCFGHSQIQANCPEEYSFFAPPGQFLTYYKWGKRYVNKHFVPTIQKDYIKHRECIYSNTKDFSRYKGKSVLLVGGGPSTVAVDWTKVKTDFIWSCGHFFLHPHLSQRSVDLFFVANEVGINKNKKLHAYLNKYPKTKACFETTSRSTAQITEFKKRFPKQCCYYHARYRSKIGAMPRLMTMATFMGFKDIYFVGMDGLPTKSTTHAFQPGKKLRGAPTLIGAEDRFRRQYVIFWDYIINILRTQANFYNLGAETKSNLSADMVGKKGIL